MKLESLAEAASIGDQLARLQQKRRIVQRVLRENGDRAFAEKMAYNAIRSDHNLEARKAAGGKAY